MKMSSVKKELGFSLTIFNNTIRKTRKKNIKKNIYEKYR